MSKMVRKKVRKNSYAELERRIGNAAILLFDYDGYYNPKTKNGSAEDLAILIDDAFHALAGFHWDKKANKRYATIKKNNSLRNR